MLKQDLINMRNEIDEKDEIILQLTEQIEYLEDIIRRKEINE